MEEPKKFYGFYFMDGKNHHKMQSYIAVMEQIPLELLLSAVAEVVRYLDFKATHGTIREFTVWEGEVRIDAASYVGKDKLQAFIFKRYGEEVLDMGEGNYSINGVDIDLNFRQYDVNIIELS